MHKIFKYGDIHNIGLTLDKDINILIYWTPSFIIIIREYKLLKWSGFWPTL